MCVLFSLTREDNQKFTNLRRMVLPSYHDQRSECHETDELDCVRSGVREARERLSGERTLCATGGGGENAEVSSCALVPACHGRSRRARTRIVVVRQAGEGVSRVGAGWCALRTAHTLAVSSKGCKSALHDLRTPPALTFRTLVSKHTFVVGMFTALRAQCTTSLRCKWTSLWILSI